MVEGFLDFVLGPLGRAVGAFYYENQILFNAIVVIIAISSLVYKYKFASSTNKE